MNYETFKTTEGNLAFVLTNEETELVLSLFREGIAAPIESNPYMYLRKESIAFIKDLKTKFGNEKIYRNDSRLKNIAWDHHIKDIASILKGLSERGYCEIVKDSNSKVPSGKIIYFILKF
jgi:hypothetical protein